MIAKSKRGSRGLELLTKFVSFVHGQIFGKCPAAEPSGCCCDSAAAAGSVSLTIDQAAPPADPEADGVLCSKVALHVDACCLSAMLSAFATTACLKMLTERESTCLGLICKQIKAQVPSETWSTVRGVEIQTEPKLRRAIRQIMYSTAMSAESRN